MARFGTDLSTARIGGSNVNEIRVGAAVIWSRVDLLSQLQPTGASATTAGYDGLPAGVASSHAMAEMDIVPVSQFTERFVVASGTYGIPAALLAAISSRESRGGTWLDENGEADNGWGVGIMQVDKRWWTIVDIGPDFGSQGHINQATSILADYVVQAGVAHPEWTSAQRLQGGTAAYNMGPDVFNYSFSAVDTITTGADYSNDVIARAQYYAANWNLLLA
jgi:hypothetical protein